MNKKYLLGLIVVGIVITSIFIYIDFFAPNPIIETPNATSTIDNIDSNSTTTPIIITSRQRIVFSLYEVKKINDTSISITSVIEDSRCPPNANCIQQGQVKIRLNAVSEIENIIKEIKSGDQVLSKSLSITLIDVMPMPVAGTSTEDSQYRFVFEITPIPQAVPSPSPGTKAPVSTNPCYIGGCSGQICSDNPNAVSTCEWRESYVCYRTAKCERQASGQCGWTDTSDLRACLANSNRVSQ
jgi:hypothetical protein